MQTSRILTALILSLSLTLLGLSSVSAANKSDKWHAFHEFTLELDETLTTYFDFGLENPPSENALNAADTFNHLINLEHQAYDLKVHSCFTEAYDATLDYIYASQVSVAMWMAFSVQTAGIAVEPEYVTATFDYTEFMSEEYVETFNFAADWCDVA